MSAKYVEIEKYVSKYSYNRIYFFNLQNLFIGPVEKYDKTKIRPELRINLIETKDEWNKRKV